MKKTTWIWLGVCIGLVAGGLLYRHFAQEVDWRGTTRLMRALEENDVSKTRQLLEGGADVNARDKSGQTALSYAARYATEPVLLQKLIVAGADPFAKDKHGFTPLMIAAQYNTQPEIVLALAKHGGNSAAQTENKNQALLLAARHNIAPVIKVLLAAHASPAAKDGNGKTAAELLNENEQLSAQEKTEWHQVLLMLEVLEAREQFKQFMPLARVSKEKQTGKRSEENTAPTEMENIFQKVLKQTESLEKAAEGQRAEEKMDSPLQADPKPTDQGPLTQLAPAKTQEELPVAQGTETAVEEQAKEGSVDQGN